MLGRPGLSSITATNKDINSKYRLEQRRESRQDGPGRPREAQTISKMSILGPGK